MRTYFTSFILVLAGWLPVVADQSQLPVSGQTPPQAAAPYRILFVGDSITMHGTNPEVLRTLKWDHACGMAATKLENDYCHQLAAMIQSRLPGRTVQICYPLPSLDGTMAAAKWGVGSAGFYADSIGSSDALPPDVVVIQLGEHERPQDGLETVRSNYDRLFTVMERWSPKPLILCTGVWDPQPPVSGVAVQKYQGHVGDQDAVVSEVCERHNIPFVSVANVAMNPACHGWGQNPGVQWHPNDQGHAGYAANLFAAYGTIAPAAK
jgi:hypothetical protein